LIYNIGALNPENTILVIYFSDEILDYVAEIKGIECRLLESKGTAPFKTFASELYE
jgi:hypothetical protein